MNYRTLALSISHHNSERTTVSSDRTGKSRSLSRAETELLLVCDSFRTLEEHARVLEHPEQPFSSTSLPLEERAAILQSFASDGFLVSEDEVIADVRTICESDLRKQKGSISLIDCLGMPTRDRPDSMAASLATYLDEASRIGRTIRVRIINAG